uniref:Phosphatidate cytidylyltransferase, mitochondrial n=1 Tax=Cyclophora tenuis TaxID=216820 RepID=A0A7S1GLK8_CYCTE
MNEWSYLYLAGRLHKPTLPVGPQDDQIVTSQVTQNLPAALAVSMLLLARKDQQQQQQQQQATMPALYEQIARLSYSGDPRVDLGGEDPDKIDKLVNAPGQFERFHEMFGEPLEDLSKSGVLSYDDKELQWNPQESSSIAALRSKLPPRFQQIPTNLLTAELRQTVRTAAKQQMFKGVLTAGVSRSARYILAKLYKGILAKGRRP